MLMIDEISIRKDLVCNVLRDIVDGFYDLGGSDRKQILGKDICVFMLRGLLSNWKYVLNYFVTDTGMDCWERISIILEL